MMQMYVSDIQAIPEEKWNATMGGCSRPASEMTAEVVSILDWASEAMAGRVRGTDEGQLIAEYKGRCSTREGASDEMRRAAATFAEALGRADDETLTGLVRAPWGLEAPLITLVHIASSHIWYHDGQLNYIQCLMGDGDYHWHG